MIKLIDILDEIKVNQPIQIKIPLIINSAEEYKKLVPILNAQGYNWLGLPFRNNDISDTILNFPVKFDYFNSVQKVLRLI